jgi:hypothetical protein
VKWGSLTAIALACMLLVGLAGVAALAFADEPLPVEEPDTAPIHEYNGVMFFGITGPESPERWPMRIDLSNDQQLRQMSPTEVQVVFSDGTESFSITAEKAHAADGARVLTTLEETGPDVVTLTVHYRAGNPAEGGAPFEYPITAGEGWEGGPFQPVIIQGPPDEAELRAMRERERAEKQVIEASPPAPAEAAPPTCRVPSLLGYSLRGAKNRLRAADCGIGAVHVAHGATAGKGKVVKQFHAAGLELAAGAPVAVKIGTSRG